MENIEQILVWFERMIHALPIGGYGVAVLSSAQREIAALKAATPANRQSAPLICDACKCELPVEGSIYHCHGAFLCQACGAK